MGERNKTVKKRERNKTLKKNCFVLRCYPFLFLHSIPQFGITECFIQYKCSVKTPPPHTIRSG